MQIFLVPLYGAFMQTVLYSYSYSSDASSQTFVQIPWALPMEEIVASHEIGTSVFAEAVNLTGTTVESPYVGKTCTDEHTKITNGGINGTFEAYKTHKMLVGMVTLLGYTCVQSKYYKLAMRLVGEIMPGFNKTLIEYAADNKDNLAEVPEAIQRRYNAVVKALKKAGIKVYDYSSISAVKMACKAAWALNTQKKVTDVFEFDIGTEAKLIAPKTLILQLSAEERTKLNAYLTKYRVSIISSKIPAVVQRAVHAHKRGTLRASYSTMTLWSRIFTAPNEHQLASVTQKVSTMFKTVEQLLKVAGTSAKLANNADSKEKAAEYWAQREVIFNQISLELSQLSTDERIQFTILDRQSVIVDNEGKSRVGLINWSLAIQLAAIKMLEEGLNSVEAARTANVQSVIKYLAGDTEEQEKALEDLSRIVQLAEKGSYQAGGEGDEFESSVLDSWKTVSYVSASLARITDMREENGSWKLIHGRQINAQSPRKWLLDSYRLANGEDVTPDPSSIAFVMSETLVGSNVEFKTLPYTHKIIGMLPEIVNSGDQFSCNFGPENEDCTMNVQIKEGVNLSKALKRLGAFGMFPEGMIRRNTVEVVELDAPYLKHEAHSGVAFISEESCNLSVGVHSTCRAFIMYKGDSCLLKCVLHVLPAGQIEKGKLFCTPDSLKTELKFHKDSKYILVGHKAEEDSVRTNRCWLAHPEVIEQCAIHEEMHTWTKLTPETIIEAAKRDKISTLQCPGLWSLLPARLVGNANNPKNLHFDMSWAGVIKVYVRAAMPWEGGMDFHGISNPYPGCIVVNPKVYERICKICGGADSDDCYYLEVYGSAPNMRDIFVFSRDPNIGIERAMLKLTATNNGIVEVMN